MREENHLIWYQAMNKILSFQTPMIMRQLIVAQRSSLRLPLYSADHTPVYGDWTYRRSISQCAILLSLPSLPGYHTNTFHEAIPYREDLVSKVEIWEGQFLLRTYQDIVQ